MIFLVELQNIESRSLFGVEISTTHFEGSWFEGELLMSISIRIEICQ